MKYILLLTLLLLAGCSGNDERLGSDLNAKEAYTIETTYTIATIVVWVDPKTNREWLIFRSPGGGISVIKREPKP